MALSYYVHTNLLNNQNAYLTKRISRRPNDKTVQVLVKRIKQLFKFS